jgi:hemerythrin-like domain-containing protein
MSDALFMLRLEHGNITRVLDVLEDQLEHIDAGAPVDGALLRLALDYLADYPDACHHPKEDLIEHKLRARDPAGTSGSFDLVGEHAQLSRETAALRDRAHARVGDPATPGDGLGRELRRFVGHYRSHLAGKETGLFAAALSKLSRDDLAEIDFGVFDQPNASSTAPAGTRSSAKDAGSSTFPTALPRRRPGVRPSTWRASRRGRNSGAECRVHEGRAPRSIRALIGVSIEEAHRIDERQSPPRCANKSPWTSSAKSNRLFLGSA